MVRKAETISKEDYARWKTDPVTGAYLQVLAMWRQALMEQWASGGFLGNNAEEDALTGREMYGRCAMLHDLLELDLEQIRETVEELEESGEQVRFTAGRPRDTGEALRAGDKEVGDSPTAERLGEGHDAGDPSDTDSGGGGSLVG